MTNKQKEAYRLACLAFSVARKGYDPSTGERNKQQLLAYAEKRAKHFRSSFFVNQLELPLTGVVE